MNTLYILIPVAIIFVAIAIKLFIWAVRSGQYDDLNTEAKRILFEEDAAETKKDKKQDDHPQ